MSCYNCDKLIDTFGNYVWCKELNRFVDYEYWNNLIPEDCPYISACSESANAAVCKTAFISRGSTDRAL